MSETPIRLRFEATLDPQIWGTLEDWLEHTPATELAAAVAAEDIIGVSAAGKWTLIENDTPKPVDIETEQGADITIPPGAKVEIGWFQADDMDHHECGLIDCTAEICPTCQSCIACPACADRCHTEEDE